MYKAMRVLAIVVLIVTIAGAGAVLYGINTLAPVVEQTSMLVTPAAQAQEIFDQAVAQVRDGTFTGRVFGDAAGLNAQNCTFLTVNVRLANRGFFPAEWIALQVQPAEGDVLQLDNVQANVLASGHQGDVSATVLHAGGAENAQRAFTVSCYVFGRKITLQGSAQ